MTEGDICESSRAQQSKSENQLSSCSRMLASTFSAKLWEGREKCLGSKRSTFCQIICSPMRGWGACAPRYAGMHIAAHLNLVLGLLPIIQNARTLHDGRRCPRWPRAHASPLEVALLLQALELQTQFGQVREAVVHMLPVAIGEGRKTSISVLPCNTRASRAAKRCAFHYQSTRAMCLAGL